MTNCWKPFAPAGARMREVVVDAAQGLALGGPAEIGFYKTTLPYVPGSVVRGALAAAWIREYGVPKPSSPHRDDFIALFEGNVLYRPLFQAGTFVVPMSAVQCKYPSTDGCRTWSVDAAFDGDAWLCPACERGVDTGKGQVSGLNHRRMLRTELDPSGRALAGHLFARQELSRGLRYSGSVIGAHPWLYQARDVWLGGKTSTSGLSRIAVSEVDHEPAPRPFRDGDRALVVRCTSPAIVVDDAGRPTMDLFGAVLHRLNRDESSLTGTPKLWVRPVRVGGWHAASGLPKPMEVAIAMGSVLRLPLNELPDRSDIARLLTDGIGLRRNEGFGAVEVNPQPWRRTHIAEEQGVAPEGALAEIGTERLLESETTVRWLLEWTRAVAVAQATPAEALNDRPARYFTPSQFAAVSRLLASRRVVAAVPLLEVELERLASEGEEAPS